MDAGYFWALYFYAGFVFFMSRAEAIRREVREGFGRLFFFCLFVCFWPLYPVFYFLDD